MNSPADYKANINPRFILNTRRNGIVMIIIGIIGILVPNVISFTLNAFVGGLFLVAAVALAANVMMTKTCNLSHWLKPFVLFVIALLILLHPAIVLSVLGLLIAIYFLLSGFSNIVLAFELKPASTWWFMLLNGAISLIFGILVISSWPFSASWLIGLLIGVSFFFDGIALVGLSKGLQRVSEKQVN
jgi:uncharacterized membrane protein HdeD (DUF308 family)